MIDSNGDYDNIAFSEEVLEGRTLENSRFDSCSFTACHFAESLFKSCRFVECCFSDCNFSMAQFDGTLLSNVDFQRCKLIGIDWTRARWPSINIPDALSFEECVLNDSSFFSLYLAGAKMVGCRIHRVDFNEADCEEVDFSDSDLEGAAFRRTSLRGANFVDAINYNIDIFENDLKGAKFALPQAIALLNALDIELYQ
ncbi:pentapeptide repeat-containing protein [Kushneria aurantia]|uniref:Pentapeptide repeat-containing protein n=1 Tax=Kushneria aurantia TaxID=504092 RepID=A0ABV6G3F7_9GAMM|nr:pentapeptide repeat-containing protein [Kushneria aurantia]